MREEIRSGDATPGRGFPVGNVVSFAVELGMGQQLFAVCLGNGCYTDRVLEDFEEHPGIGVIGRQTGKTLARAGAQPFAALKAHIDRLLAPE